MEQASATDQYRANMTRYFDELTQIYEVLLQGMLSGRPNLPLVDGCISKMITIMVHLLPKIIGAGEPMKDLVTEFKKYENWMKNPSLPKTSKVEADKIPELFFLIVQAYDRIGLSNIVG